MTQPVIPPQMEEPLAELERRLIEESLRGAGESTGSLRGRDEEIARKLLADAATYAAARLAEVEARSHYVRKLHKRRVTSLSGAVAVRVLECRVSGCVRDLTLTLSRTRPTPVRVLRLRAWVNTPAPA